jgi:hypothetical protein
MVSRCGLRRPAQSPSSTAGGDGTADSFTWPEFHAEAPGIGYEWFSPLKAKTIHKNDTYHAAAG